MGQASLNPRAVGPVGWHREECVWPGIWKLPGWSRYSGYGGSRGFLGAKDSMLSLRPQGHPGEEVIVWWMHPDLGDDGCITSWQAPHPQAGMVVAAFLPGLGDSGDRHRGHGCCIRLLSLCHSVPGSVGELGASLGNRGPESSSAARLAAWPRRGRASGPLETRCSWW